MALTLDLSKFIAEIDHRVPVYFQRRSNKWLKQLRKMAHNEGLLPARVAGISLDCLDILRAEINVKNGIALSRLEIAQKILDRYPNEEIVIEEVAANNSVTELSQIFPDGRKRIKTTPWIQLIIPRMRSFAYKARQQIVSKRSLNGKIDLSASKNSRKLFVLSRHISHLKVIMPVVSYLRERYDVEILFGVVTEELNAACKNAGYESLNLTHLSSESMLKGQSKQVQAELCEFMSNLKPGHFSFELTEAELTVMNRETKQVLKDNLNYSLRVIEGVKIVLEEFQPSLFFANNPYATEGRAATHVAKSFKIPTSSSEHGSIFPNDPIWQECIVDLVCVFGEPSRRALLSCDVRPEQIAVTGAPQFDEIYKWTQKENIKDDAIILVATSGPGDQVSLEQHLRFINILYEAAGLSQNLRWVVKLHSKDNEDYYNNIAKNFPSAQVEVLKYERLRFGKDIFDYLAKSRGLLTICSTSALDAMLGNVPVITVALESKEKGLEGIEFIERDCTLRVETAEELAQAAQMICQEKVDEKVKKNALNYIHEHYSNLGNATEKVALQLLKLMEAN